MESKKLGEAGLWHYPAEDQDCNFVNSTTISLGTVVERRFFPLTSTHLIHQQQTLLSPIYTKIWCRVPRKTAYKRLQKS